ncbi:hypothetical protein HB364_25260 [Pseudoflavitalea sp. X16]|uniref:type VI secretion system baseplate subunit TssF n=1 Tax=Paraflavitalea devenefica TaxID=2716334 RepID=UPI0014207ADB|nr:type VI secretion system baseplate subunit TssF [Paraflavitalea devenefica]NII28416.1 hypothetical protein [Paraflavitalea devenefica]
MENREQIKNRMIKTAARLWGYTEDESASAFDPLVNLLFTACALELEKISGEVAASRGRLLERMVQLLSPEVLNGPLPAHAVLHARAIEEGARLRDSDQFFVSQRITTAYESGNNQFKDIFFSPTAPFHINSAAVQYLATGYQLFCYREKIAKEVIAHCLPGRELSPAVLWLGIAGSPSSLHQTQCYFEIRNEVNRGLFYSNLPAARWYYGDREIMAEPGYNQEEVSGERLDIEELLTRKNTSSYKIKEQVNAFYKNRFITLLEKENVAGAGMPMPAELLQCFDKKDLQGLQQQSLRWIKIVFPENIPAAVLQDVVCHFNCFPVINRQLHELSYRMHDLVNIIPLQAADSFFDLHEITDQEGTIYNLRTVRKNEKEKLSVLLRQGGIARFDERNAAAIVEHIIQLLSDESAAFAVLGREFMAGEMKQLQQLIYKLEQQLQNRQLHREHTPFLVVRPTGTEKINNLLITFWSTGGSQGNQVKAGTSLQTYKTADGYHHQDIILVSGTVGGRDRLSAAESITAYKSALLSRDRLVSLEDIKLFCQLQLGNKAQKVQVEKGVMVAQQVAQGFARTIDVRIVLSRKDYLDAQEKNQLTFWKEDLVLQLSKKSAGLTPFRVFIEEAA